MSKDDREQQRRLGLSMGRRGEEGRSPPSALSSHVSYLPSAGATAVIRAATREDVVAVARLVARGIGSNPDKRERKERIRAALGSLRDRRTIIHVVELDGRLCGAVCLQLSTERRMFASEAVMTEAGRSFDPALALKLVEHVVECCRADGWPELHYLADLDDAAADALCASLRRRGVDCSTGKPRIRLMERMRFGGRSRMIIFRLPEEARGSDRARQSDPRIVWF